MADKKISDLPAAGPLLGTEQIELNQGGVSVRSTLAGIAAKFQTVPTIERKTLAFGAYTNNSGFPILLVVVMSANGMSGDTSLSYIQSTGYDDETPEIGFADSDAIDLSLQIIGSISVIIPNGQSYTLATQDPGGAQPNAVLGHYWVILETDFVP